MGKLVGGSGLSETEAESSHNVSTVEVIRIAEFITGVVAKRR